MWSALNHSVKNDFVVISDQGRYRYCAHWAQTVGLMGKNQEPTKTNNRIHDLHWMSGGWEGCTDVNTQRNVVW